MVSRNCPHEDLGICLSSIGRTHEVQKENGNLSPTLSMGKEYPSRRRAASLAPSHSGRSVHTVLEHKSKYFGELPGTLKSQKTMGVKIKVSWWDLLKAFFSGPSKFAAKMASRIEPDTQELDEKVRTTFILISRSTADKPQRAKSALLSS